MNTQTPVTIERTTYNRDDCRIGIVHLGYGAFHRAHQAVFLDDYMQESGDLNWGIAAVNLRREQSVEFQKHLEALDQGYLLKTTSPNGVANLRAVRSHVHFSDWAKTPGEAENLVSLPSVKALSMTVTESGYYLDDNRILNINHPVIADELGEGEGRSLYAFLVVALKKRMERINQPITILCCDNIRSNGHRLAQNFRMYLECSREHELMDWLDRNATFPNSMVDRITPRATQSLDEEISRISPDHSELAIHAESYLEWVLERSFADEFPALDLADVSIVEDVDPYEEAKIRILNGGHTALCYLGALAGYNTFDEAMSDPILRAHFDRYQGENVLPGLSLELPFDKAKYCALIAERLSNAAIADTLGRICMDGWSKFPIFVRPTLEGCLARGISPAPGYDSIASWYVYARRFSKQQTHIEYIEPYWDQLEPLLGIGKEAEFAGCEALWSNLPTKYDDFVPAICSAIQRMEETWPV